MSRTGVITAVLVGALTVFSGCSGDSGKAPQEEKGEHRMTAEEHNETMVRQHQSMVTLQEEWAKAKSAAEAGKGEEALTPAGKMEEAARYQEEFMLHKNPEKRDEFLKKAREFRSLVMDFRQYAQKGDTRSLKELAPEIDKACNDCHQSFR